MTCFRWHRLATLAGGLGLLPLASASSQVPAASPVPSVSTGVLYACFVPHSGTVYRIKEAGLPDDCRGKGIEFSWNTEGTQGPQGEKGDKGDTGDTGPAGAGADPAALVALQNNIDAEAAARVAADHTLQGNIDAEAAARNEGDAAVLQSAKSYADAQIAAIGGGDVAAEAAARMAADVTLQSNIDAEAAARAAGDTQLQTNIDSETSARQAADVTLQSNVDNEAVARMAGDTQLQMNINNEAAARQAADNTLQSNINAEAAARQAADAATGPASTLLVLQAPFSAFGSPYAVPSATRSNGLVSVVGLLNSPGTGVLAVLPPAYRPAARLVFGTMASTGGIARIDVLPTGEIQLFTPSGSWLSLSGISFPAP